MRRVGFLAALLAVAYDLCFWEQSPGLAWVAAASATVAALALAPGRRWSRGAAALIALALPLGLAAAWGARPVLAPALIVLLVSMLAATWHWGPLSAWPMFGEGLFALVLGWLAAPIRALERSFGPERTARTMAPRFAAVDLLIPVGLLLVFGSLLVSANPVLETLGLRYWGWLAEALEGVTPGRVMFWLGCALVAAGWLAPRHRLADLFPPGRGSEGPSAPTWPAGRELATAIWSLALLNALFLVHNLTEGVYLWGGRRPPQGAGYVEWAEYARSGSYQLMAAVVLAAIVLCAFLRLRGAAATSSVARGLAYAWLGQNLLVVTSAARRLSLHVEAYGLSHLRLNGWIWLALVVAGYVLLTWKIARARPLRWLLARCVAASFIALYAASAVDADALIARWNLEPAHRAAMIEVDYPYLFRLGDGAYPHLVVLLEDDDLALRVQAQERLQNRLRRIDERLARGWPSWTWQRAQVRRAIAETLAH